MVVACDNCGAKYNLEESKIPERGARITCKKCMHVFRVYPSSTASEEEVELDFSSFDSPKQDIPLTPPPPKQPEEEPAVQEQPEAVATEDQDAEDVTGMDVYALDFQKVGLKFWKVKIKIGFTYDFSDFKTFVKSLREGRINDTDLLSHDGSNWIPINEIDDLEVYFCRLYKKLEKSATEPEESAPKPSLSVGDSSSSGPSNINDLASAIADAESEVNSAFSPVSQSRPQRAVQNRNRPIRKKRTPVPPPTKNNFPLGLVAFAAVVLIGGGLWFAFSSDSSSKKAPASNNDPGFMQKHKAKKVDDALNAAKERMDQNKQKIAAEKGIELPSDKPAEKETENLEAVVPQEVLDARNKASQGGSAPKVKKAADYAKEGAAAIKSRNYKLAARSYAQAAKSKPLGEYYERQGYALYKQGKFEAAEGVLKTAGSLGYKKAYKLLGEIYRDEYGDDAGASGYFDKAK